jgi:hypothetical protein
MENILTKIVSMNKKNWSKKLIEVVWAYNITWKTTTWLTPFELVYGKKSMLPIEFEYRTLRTTSELNMDIPSTQKERLNQLNSLDEYRMQALFNTEVVQQQRKYWHDKKIKHGKFKEGDWALLYDSRFKDFKGKLMTRWLGPYIIEKCHDNGSVQIRTIDEEGIPLLVNGFRLKVYNKPMTREEFTTTVKTQNLDVIDSRDALNPSK